MWKNEKNVSEISCETGFDARTIRHILAKKPKYMKKFRQFEPVKFKYENLRLIRSKEWKLKQMLSHSSISLEKILKIYKLFEQGKTRREISRIIKTDYNNVNRFLRNKDKILEWVNDAK
jgi:hypothetical protein